jgi:hypothetical protein
MMDQVTSPSTAPPPWLDDFHGGMSAESARLSWEAAERRRKEEQAERERAPKPLELTLFDQCGQVARRRWISKGMLARGETSAWIAPPGAGKSALLTEISVHCAAGRDWRGHKAKERCGVVIFALERADLYKRRLEAYRQRDKLSGLPIAVAGDVIDLMNPACVALIAATVADAEKQFGHSVGLDIFDTYSKGIAAGGGDEDKARDHNRAAVNLRNLHTKLNVHIALVGHTGKDETRGARGSNAHLGDVDVMVQISGDTIKVAEVKKGNDQGERAIAEYRIELIEVGRDEDGEPEMTSIVTTEHFETSARKAKRDKLAPIPKAALRALHELIADGEIAPRPDNIHVPVGVTCVTLENWKKRLDVTGIINRDGNYREQFRRINVTLRNAGFIGIWDNIVWPVT